MKGDFAFEMEREDEEPLTTIEKQISHLTLREHYAGLAMAGLEIANQFAAMQSDDSCCWWTEQEVAEFAVGLADALVEELKK